MEITIIHPADGSKLGLKLQPEDYNGEPALRVIFPGKDSFLMSETHDGWQILDHANINPDLVKAIISELKPHTRYN